MIIDLFLVRSRQVIVNSMTVELLKPKDSNLCKSIRFKSSEKPWIILLMRITQFVIGSGSLAPFDNCRLGQPAEQSLCVWQDFGHPFNWLLHNEFSAQQHCYQWALNSSPNLCQYQSCDCFPEQNNGAINPNIPQYTYGVGVVVKILVLFITLQQPREWRFHLSRYQLKIFVQQISFICSVSFAFATAAEANCPCNWSANDTPRLVVVVIVANKNLEAESQFELEIFPKLSFVIRLSYRILERDTNKLCEPKCLSDPKYLVKVDILALNSTPAPGQGQFI